MGSFQASCMHTRRSQQASGTRAATTPRRRLEPLAVDKNDETRVPGACALNTRSSVSTLLAEDYSLFSIVEGLISAPFEHNTTRHCATCLPTRLRCTNAPSLPNADAPSRFSFSGNFRLHHHVSSGRLRSGRGLKSKSYPHRAPRLHRLRGRASPLAGKPIRLVG